MKVYVKKEDKNTKVPGIIVTVLFLSVSIGIFIAAFTSDRSFADIIASALMLLVFALVFFGFAMYFVYALFKKPKGYEVTLVNKKIETYNGKHITCLEFNTEETEAELEAMKQEEEMEEEFISPDYKCYTIGENNLVVGNKYSLLIKEFNWEPKSVEEIKNPSTGAIKI